MKLKEQIQEWKRQQKRLQLELDTLELTIDHFVSYSNAVILAGGNPENMNDLPISFMKSLAHNRIHFIYVPERTES